MWAGISRHAVHIAAASAGCRTTSVGTGRTISHFVNTRSRKQFSPLCRSCNARGNLFMCVKCRTKWFYSPEMSCEARAGLFKC